MPTRFGSPRLGLISPWPALMRAGCARPAPLCPRRPASPGRGASQGDLETSRSLCSRAEVPSPSELWPQASASSWLFCQKHRFPAPPHAPAGLWALAPAPGQAFPAWRSLCTQMCGWPVACVGTVMLPRRLDPTQFCPGLCVTGTPFLLDREEEPGWMRRCWRAKYEDERSHRKFHSQLGCSSSSQSGPQPWIMTGVRCRAPRTVVVIGVSLEQLGRFFTGLEEPGLSGSSCSVLTIPTCGTGVCTRLCVAFIFWETSRGLPDLAFLHPPPRR
ncbi:uncharacterized protein LOC130883605 [Chionomys nivalis]|uniref:uncharacterized protein LOC130883605 n=1 Tax=Chionomys nivalis TaxID=269649 RepID=UPI002597409A|nr:uncharacterized protein LOC130883605 [Chionomys nivalis]